MRKLPVTTRPRAPEPWASRSEAEAAVRTLLAWAGDDPDRTELRLAPARVAEGAALQDRFLRLARAAA